MASYSDFVQREEVETHRPSLMKTSESLRGFALYGTAAPKEPSLTPL